MSEVLTKSWQVKSAAVMKKREGDFSISYADVAQTACRTGPPQYAKFGNASRYLNLKLSEI